MRLILKSALSVFILLGTGILIQCFADEESLFGIGSGDLWSFNDHDLDIPSEDLKGYWKEAENIYKTQLHAQFLNGSQSHSRKRRSFSSNTEFSNEYSKRSNVFEIYTDILTTRHKISKRQAYGSSNSTPVGCGAPAPVSCVNVQNSRFRTVDGTCNNLQNVQWGSANRTLNRMLSSVYEDGFASPRGGLTNSRLPNARAISVAVHPDYANLTNRQVTNMVPQFGQFVDHDISLTPNAGGPCCATPGSDVNCWSINVENDAFFKPYTRCLDFTRSTPCIRNGRREQMNLITAYIDGSQIYGSTTQRSNSLRSFSGGMLKTNGNFQGFVPLKGDVGVTTNGDFGAGDDRVNEMPGLTVLHNVFLKEHNRIAQAFQRVTGGGWTDERIYQETRRIVIAQLQQVTYNEYLPIILGPTAMWEKNLAVGGWSNYEPSTDATMVNEFVTAAYRFGHSMVSGLVGLFNAQDQQIDSFLVGDEYFQSRQITRDNGQGYDMILRGLMKQNAPAMDRFVTTGVTNMLFKPQNADFGSDLVARNIQRGRDHGLRNYNAYRVACGGTDINQAVWSVVPPNISGEGWEQASKIYGKPSDIDLFVGGLIELPVQGGLSGPTFTCIKAMQFARSKFGDRYFFTHNQPTGFTAAQLVDISRRRLSDIICDNSQQPNAPANAFLVESPSNPMIDCANAGRPWINLKNFR